MILGFYLLSLLIDLIGTHTDRPRESRRSAMRRMRDNEGDGDLRPITPWL